MTKTHVHILTLIFLMACFTGCASVMPGTGRPSLPVETAQAV